MWRDTGSQDAAMNDRGKINFIIDLLMFLNFALIAGIGLLMKFTLPPGRERIAEFGSTDQLLFLGLDRHQWGTIHLTAAYVMLALLALHLILHWPAIKVLARKLVPDLWLRRVLAAGLILLGAGLMLFSFLVKPDKTGKEKFPHRNFRSNRGWHPAAPRNIQETPNQDGSGSKERPLQLGNPEKNQ